VPKVFGGTQKDVHKIKACFRPATDYFVKFLYKSAT